MIRPLGNRVIVRRLIADKIGSIVLPESLKDDFNTGGCREWLVLAVGTGRITKKGVRVPIECSAGDRIISHSYTAGAQELGNGDHIITTDQIIAVIPKQT